MATSDNDNVISGYSSSGSFSGFDSDAVIKKKPVKIASTFVKVKKDHNNTSKLGKIKLYPKELLAHYQ
jgi:hypothetical protein